MQLNELTNQQTNNNDIVVFSSKYFFQLCLSVAGELSVVISE